MSEDQTWTPAELAALKARVEFASARVVDDEGDWLSISGAISRADDQKMSREQMEAFMNDFLALVESHGLGFLGSCNLAVDDYADGGPPELDQESRL